MQTEISLHKGFLECVAKMDWQLRERLVEFLIKFIADRDAKGLKYEELHGMRLRGLYSAHVNDNYRAIIYHGNGISRHLMLWVGLHDKAYEWASRRRCGINPYTGSFQDYEAPRDAAPRPAAQSLFARVTDGQLLRLGVPEDMLPYVRGVSSRKDYFANVHGWLPGDAAVALLDVLDGQNAESVIVEMFGKDPGQTRLGEASMPDTPANRSMIHDVTDEDDLEKALNYPLETWRLYLHPTQRRIAEGNFSGAARVLGGAGTGKTVVAMHRAKYLASQCRANERVLFTLFSVQLTEDIRASLQKICTPQEITKIDLVNLDKWVSDYVKQKLGLSLLYDDDGEYWTNALRVAGVEGAFTPAFLRDEWKLVVQAQDITTVDEYERTDRAGRVVRLDRDKRREIWKVFEEYLSILRREKKRDISLAMNECRRHFLQNPQPYKHVIVDEAQDIKLYAMRLLRALAGKERPNDLFVTGDARQRIYGEQASFSKAGIHIRGRSGKLKICYRTTAEIGLEAARILEGVTIDDLDGGAESDDRMIWLCHGSGPETHAFRNLAGETAFIAEKIKELTSGGVLPREICVAARTNKMVDVYKAALERAGVPTFTLSEQKADNQKHEGVRVATMHRVKGLEFTCMILAGMNKGIMPYYPAWLTDRDEKRKFEEDERKLLYMAKMRARKHLFLTGYGALSEWLASPQGMQKLIARA